MARNKIEDLRNHLFAQMERLNEDELKGDELMDEIKKAKALGSLSNAIIETAKTEINFIKTTGMNESKSQFFKGIDDNTLKINQL